MDNVLKFPSKDQEIKEVERIVWPNKTEVIRRRVIDLVRKKEASQSTMAMCGSDWLDVEMEISGLLQALYIIEQECK